MGAEEYFTENRLLEFAVNYKKYPVLWCSWHPKYADVSDRSRAYRRLAAAQGVPGGTGIMRRMERLCQYFHRRVKQEVARLAAAEAGIAAPEAPEWAVAAERYLCLKAFAKQPAPERRLLRLVRGMRRGARAGAGLGTRAAAELAPRLGLPAAQTVKLWRELRDSALAAVHQHILRGDAPGECAPSALQWAVADLSVLYGGAVTADEHYQKVETLQALLGTFHLVQQYGLEPAARSSAAAWARAARLYSRKGAAASALLLQRRWFELREATRRRLAAPPGGLPALPLHRAIADRYPAVVSDEPASWEQLRREGRLARPTNASGPAPGETFCLGCEDDESGDEVSDKEEANDDDVILVEREIETIDVDGDDSADERPAARAPQGLPDLDVCELPDADEPGHAVGTGQTRHQPTTVSKYRNKAKTPFEESVGVKQVDTPVAGASELQDNGDINQDTGAGAGAADVEKGTEKTVDVNEQTDTTIGDCALTIANIINQTAACSKTNITDSGSKNIDAAVNTGNKVHDNVEVSTGSKKESTVSKYSDKTIDDSKEIVDLNKTIDHNLLEALQDLDADFVETVILFESDEDDVKVKADPNDEQTQRKRLSGPKSKMAQLRNRIQFESDEEGLNTNAQDASDNGQLDGVDEASGSRVNNEDEDIKSAVTTENARNTETSEINQMCSENPISHIDQNLGECRPSVISRKRRLSESSESDSGLLVIADSADDIRDDSEDRTLVDKENEEVDVVGVSDDDAATSGSPSVVRYPLLVELLKSKSDDLNRYKRFEEIKRRVKMEAKKLLKQRCEEIELDAIATKVVRESLAQSNSRIQLYVRNIVNELNEGSASDDADDEPEQFDEKLLMIPVVALTRISLPTRAAAPGRLPRSFLSLARNRRLLARCRPCRVQLARCDRGPARVAKRVRLPDIDAVRALNRTIATAQVAPISAAAVAAEGAGAEAGTAASAGPSAARACVHSEREYALGCGPCAVRALARPATSRAAAELQRRALRRTARLARYQQVLADRQHGKKPRTVVEHAPAPAHPPRARSPYDAQRALKEWLREKSIVAEKFGIKPRTYRKQPAPAEPAAPVGPPAPPADGARSIVTMNKAGELNPPLLLNNCSQLTQTVAAHYVVDNEGAVLSAVTRPPPDRPGLLVLADCPRPAHEGLAGAHQATQSGDAGPRQYRTAFTLNPVSQGYSPNKSTTQIVVTQTSSSGQTGAKTTPKFFNLNCVANINKTLNTLATHEPLPPAPEAGEGLLPIITHVESLAVNNRSSPPRPLTLSGQTTITPIPRPTSQNIAQQGTSGNTQCNASFANSSQGNVMLSGGFLTTQSGYIIQRPQSETQAQLSTVIQKQNICGTTSANQPAIQYNTVPAAAPRPDASQVVLVASQPATVTQPRPIFQRQANMLQVNSVQAGPPQTNSLLLAPQSSSQGQLTMTLVNQALVKPKALQVTTAHAGLPKTNSLAVGPQNPIPSVLKTKQMSMLPSEERRVVLLNANLQANGVQISSVQAAPPQTNAVLISAQNAQKNLNKMILNQHGSNQSATLLLNPARRPSPPQASPQASPQTSPQTSPQASPPASLQTSGAGGARQLLFEKLESSLPAEAARAWAAGRDPTALSVLANASGTVWRVAGHLVLGEAAAPRAAERIYALGPLRQLILPEEEDRIKLDAKKRDEKKAKEAAPNQKKKDPSVSWLKVKSFAKMGNDVAPGDKSRDKAGGGEDTDSADEVEVLLRAPPRVCLEDKVYVKLSETPLIYAKVLHDVSGPAACRARLLRREPVFLYSLRAHSLTPVYGEPSADGASITLTAAKDLFGALHELAACLAPPGGPAPVHKRLGPSAPSASSAPPAPVAPVAPPAPAPGPAKAPVTLCDSATRERYSKLMKYMAYTPDTMTGGTKKLIKNKSKSRGALEPGEGRARARRGREAPPARPAPPARLAPRPPRPPALPTIDLDSSGDD